MKCAWYLFFLFSFPLMAAQVVNRDYQVKNNTPHYATQEAPLVMVDAAHHNFHTLDGRYAPFGKVLASDGYRLQTNSKPFTKEGLNEVDILVMANALHENNLDNWDLPNYSALQRGEVEAVYQWVKEGGALMLIADHMPWPKASAELAAMFGFGFNNGFVEFTGLREQYFERDVGSLQAHPIQKGLLSDHEVTKVRGFVGQAFLIPPQAEPLLTFVLPATSLMPKRAFQFEPDTPEINVTGWHQAATIKVGQGRVAMFGEAGMFTSQWSGKGDNLWPMGLHAPGSEQNERFLLNVMLWLSGALD